jgi:hypothetical protein
MLNGLKPKISTGSDFEPIPMDRYTVLCVDVTMIKNRKFQSNEEEDVLNYKFQILDDKPIPVKEGDTQSTRGRFVWHKCRLAYNDRSWLARLIKAVVGRELTKGEVESFDLESIIGKQVDIMLTQKESNGKIFNNIIEFSKNAKQLQPVEGFELGEKTVLQKTTVPATAPVDEAESMIKDMEEEGKKAETVPAAPALSEEDSLRQQLAAIEAKKKADAALAEK